MVNKREFPTRAKSLKFIVFLGQLETNHHSLPQLSDETRARILTIIKELGQNNISVVQNKDSSVKLAFVDRNFYICSTCSGVVQHV